MPPVMRSLRQMFVLTLVAAALLGCRTIGYTRSQVRDRWVATYEQRLDLTHAQATCIIDRFFEGLTDHQLRPLFSSFQARTLPLGVYASEQDFSGYEISSNALRERIALAAARALPLLTAPRVDEVRATPVAQAA